MRKFKLRSFVALLAVLALTAAACGGDDEPTDDGGNTGAQHHGRLRHRRHQRGRPARQDLRRGRHQGLDRPGVPAAVVAEPGDERVRGLRHRRRHRDRREARRRDRVGDAEVGGHHGRQLAGPLGHERRFDDGHRGADRGPGLLARRTTTRRPPSRWHEDSDDHDRSISSTARRSACVQGAPTTSTCRARWTSRATRSSRRSTSTVKGYDTDSTAIQALVSGQVDGAMSATPTLEAAIEKGQPIRLVGDPLFYEPLSVAFDKESELDQASLVAAVSDIVDEMHSDGIAHRSVDAVVRHRPDGQQRGTASHPSERGTRGDVRGEGGRGDPAPRPTTDQPHGGVLAGERPRLLPTEGRARLGRDLPDPGRSSSTRRTSTRSSCATGADFVVKGLVYTIIIALASDRPGDPAGAGRSPRSAVAQFDRLRRLRLLHVVLPRDAADRAAVPHRVRAAAGRRQNLGLPETVEDLLTLDPFIVGILALGSELRRVHDRDLPRRHPVGEPRAVRGRGGARHDVPPEDEAGRACRRPSA